MKKTLKPILSCLLVFAMLLPFAVGAWATEASAIKLDKTSEQTLYVRNSSTDGNRVDKITVTATITPADYDGKIIWTISDTEAATASLALGSALDNTEGNRKIELTAKAVTAAKTASLTATVSGAAAVSVPIRVVPDAVQDFELKLGKTTLEPGGTTTASAAPKYASGDAAKVSYSSSDASVARVDANTGAVTAVKVGTATITATAGGVKATKTLTVSPISFNYTAAVEQEFSLSVLRDDLIRKFSSVSFSNSDEVTFSGINASAEGTLYDFDDEVIGNRETCTFRQLNSITFMAGEDEDFTFTVTVKHDGVNYTANVTIKSRTAVIDLYIPIDGAEDYSFADKSATGKTGVKIITDAFADFGDFAIDGSFVFEKPDRASKKIGTLSVSSDDSDDVSGLKYVNAIDLDGLYFLPLVDSGTFEIEYSAYSQKNGKGSLIAEGTLTIALDAESLEVSAQLADTEPYTFSEWVGDKNSDSVEDLLIDAIDDVLGKTGWGGVRFDTDKLSKTSDAVGTLYLDDSSIRSTNAVSSDDYVAKASLGDLYFVPDEAGSYEVAFAVYKSTGSAVLATGTLTLNVANNFDSMDFHYATTAGDSVALDEDDFAAFVQDAFGLRYSLAYITLDSVSGGGTFYDGSSKFTPGRSGKEYYEEDYDDAPRRASYINDLSFTAPGKSGMTIVEFTAYGYRGNNDPEEVEGTFCIFYSAEDVPDVTYYGSQSGAAAISTIKLDEEQFVAAYRTATGSKTAKPQFSIRFLSLPGAGSLYQTPATTGGKTRILTEDDLDVTEFTVGASKGTRSTAIITYIPTYVTGAADTATYLAYDSNDTPMYIGTIRFVLSAPRNVKVNSEGLDFAAADFTNPGDPITYVTFKTPASGKLYVTSGKRLLPVAETTKLWITDSKAGDQPISATHYVPKAGETKAVTLTYTAHTASGASYDNTITVTPTTKTASAKFTDIPAGMAAWSADAIDFASKYGLVQGDGKGSFMPTNTMTRRDLILIFYRMAGSPAATGTMRYTDVPAGTDSYSTEIYNSALWADQNGIMDGVVTGAEYQPKNNVTRQEFVRILYNYAKYSGASVANKGSIDKFQDASKVASWATEAMKWAIDKGYTTGTSVNPPLLDPTATTNRAQIVTFLHRYLTF